MGQVYLAHDALLDRPVSVKFVLAASASARARILEEARAIARLHHPNVVAIYRVAEVADHPYLVSEYVQGRSLQDLERPMPWREALNIAIDLARGLAAAHRRGVLHRDVKPANAILTDEGRAKLLDFGLTTITPSPPEEIASTSDPEAADTNSSVADPGRHFVGTPRYTAPEIWRGERASRQSDLFSLGLLLYELLSGRVPHGDVAFP